MKPGSGVMQTAGSPLLQGSQSSHGTCGGTILVDQGPSPFLLESCFHPSPCRKKSLIQAIENICKSNYLPRALPGALPPPCSLRSLRLGFLQPGCFPGHTQRAGCRSSFTRSNSAASSPSSHRGPGRPSPALGWVLRELWSRPGSTPHTVAHLLQGSAVHPSPGIWPTCPAPFLPHTLRGAGQGSPGHSVPAAFPLIVIF